jgi:hypothetical protein
MNDVSSSDNLLMARVYLQKKQKDKIKELTEIAVSIDRKALGTDSAKVTHFLHNVQPM